jgi:glycosyltransferase involved in cell wall biosynthesis
VGGAMRWLALRPPARLARGVAAIGSRAAAAYAQLTHREQRGVSPPVWNIPYYCANEAFLRIDRSILSPDCRAAHFLYCGQIVPRKGVDMLVRSFCRLARERVDVRLTLVGDGPLRANLAASVPEAIRHRVTWAGFKEADELSSYFAESNVFVLPSVHDGWGVVINQAVSAGMAVIASDGVGAAVDLVCDHGNGLVFPSQNEEALTAALRFFAEHPDAIHQYGEASRARAQAICPERGADRWYQFCRTVLSRSRVVAEPTR